MQFSALGDVLLLGDFNARRVLLKDVPNEVDIPARLSKDMLIHMVGTHLIFVLDIT